jgi:hypothetical protein
MTKSLLLPEFSSPFSDLPKTDPVYSVMNIQYPLLIENQIFIFILVQANRVICYNLFNLIEERTKIIRPVEILKIYMIRVRRIHSVIRSRHWATRGQLRRRFEWGLDGKMRE